jgi:hypothetical protein
LSDRPRSESEHPIYYKGRWSWAIAQSNSRLSIVDRELPLLDEVSHYGFDATALTVVSSRSRSL